MLPRSMGQKDVFEINVGETLDTNRGMCYYADGIGQASIGALLGRQVLNPRLEALSWLYLTVFL
jgi:hypothetical protein